MHRNTAYWPERFTAASLAAEAKEWREKASAFLDAAAAEAAHKSLRKNASRAAQEAAKDPTPAKLNTAGSLGNLVADSADALQADLERLREWACPLPPASVIVYREPEDPDQPGVASWAAEALVHDAPSGRQSRAEAALRVHGYPTKAAAGEALRAVALNPEIVRHAQGSDYHAARVKAAAKAALECEPVEVEIRVAGKPRPEGWEEIR